MLRRLPLIRAEPSVSRITHRPRILREAWTLPPNHAYLSRRRTLSRRRAFSRRHPLLKHRRKNNPRRRIGSPIKPRPKRILERCRTPRDIRLNVNAKLCH
jgi:hypothetical protein